jgi:glycosyltransferase involved in cell wall biosynthesis
MKFNNKKILHIVGDSKFGGASIVILKLAQMAREMGCEVDVLTNDEKFIRILSHEGFGVVDLDLIRRKTNPIKDFFHTLKLAKFIKNNKYDLVHTHTTKGGLVGRLAAWLASCENIIHTVHGFAFHEETGTFKTFLFASLEKIAALWCHHIITVSYYHREWALKLGIGNSSKLIAIPNGISAPDETSLDIEALRIEFGVSPDMVLLFCGGRIAKQKGLEYLLRAMPIVNSNCDNKIKLIIAGEGDLEDELRLLAISLGLDADAIFIGFRRDMGDLLRAADLVVLPSLREGLSISLLEAMATGKAIITTTIGSNLEATKNGEAAMLVSPKNSEELANAIVELGSEEKKREVLGSKAKDIYQNNYTEERMVKSHRDLYTRCLKP